MARPCLACSINPQIYIDLPAIDSNFTAGTLDIDVIKTMSLYKVYDRRSMGSRKLGA
jgi:hypothetical protein